MNQQCCLLPIIVITVHGHDSNELATAVISTTSGNRFPGPASSTAPWPALTGGPLHPRRGQFGAQRDAGVPAQ